MTFIIVLLLLLLISVGINIILYQQANKYYLQLNQTRLDPLNLSHFPTEKPQNLGQNQNRLVVFFGDSRAAAWTAPTQISNFTFANRGIIGETTAQVLGRLPDHVLPLKPDIVVLQVGINDLKTIPIFPDQTAAIAAQCKANIEQIVEMLTKNNIRVVITTIFPLGALPIERRLFWSDAVEPAVNDANQFILTLARNNVKVFDTSLVLSDRKGIVKPIYSRDFVHLNKAGYEALNRELSQILKP
jgi:lysophospholipase L1-like esterase